MNNPKPAFDFFPFPGACSRRHTILTLAGVMALLLAGCRTPSMDDMVVGSSYKPSNVYHSVPKLPPNLRRVGVLPMTILVTDNLMEAGRATLEPVLWSELIKAKAFEICRIPPEQLRQWAGKNSLAAEEKLPPLFLQQARESLACQAVLFCRLTQYRPYKPLVIGWNIKLVDCQTAEVLWSIDEVFNAGTFSVSNGARRYYQEQLYQSRPLSDSTSVLSSPLQFGQYTLPASVATLPRR